MKTCPKCESEHSKPGSHCSRSCANSRGPRTTEFKAAITKALGGKIKVKRPLCLECKAPVKTMRNRFCSQDCWTNSLKSTRSAWREYHRACRFKFNVYEYPDLFDIKSIEAAGWYSPITNPNGMSRDHKFSVRAGFDLGVDPELISHVLNCEIIPFQDNNKKHTYCSISIQELEESINTTGSVGRAAYAPDCKSG